MAAPIDLCCWPTPNSWKVTIALEEMGLPYTVRLVDIGAGDQFATDALAISPNNRAPAIVDPEGPDGPPVSVFKSGAIALCLARKTLRLLVATERDRIAVAQPLMWQTGGVGAMAGQAHHVIRHAPALDPPQELPATQDRDRREVGRLDRVLNGQLAEARCAAGDVPVGGGFRHPALGAGPGTAGADPGRQADPRPLAGRHEGNARRRHGNGRGG